MHLSAITKPELRAMLALHRNLLKQLENIEATDVNCRRCIHGGEAVRGRDLCGKWKTTPPEDVQKVGCDDWEWDCIPF